jgi:hypothetical protein
MKSDSVLIEKTNLTQLNLELRATLKKELENFQKQFSPEKSDEFLTRKETATFLKISLVTLHQWAKDGVLKPLKKGNRTYFSKMQIEKSLYNSNTKVNV